jgi:hypothetical protein
MVANGRSIVAVVGVVVVDKLSGRGNINKHAAATVKITASSSTFRWR